KFLQDCLQNNIKIYSTDKSNFVGIRRPAVETHSWQSDETSILSNCQIVTQTSNFMDIITS
ncbi:MAG: hypothetical protein ABFC94_01480, partial [Syntrophomonas sp.]